MASEIFILYADEDKKMAVDLEKHFKPLEHAGLITVYHEGKILGGECLKCTIRMHIQQAGIILPLFSSDFVASSSYIEIERVLQHPEQIAGRIIPIILRAVDWQTGPFGALKALPTNNIPVRNWSDRDRAWTAIVQHIRTVVVEPSLCPHDTPVSTSFTCEE